MTRIDWQPILDRAAEIVSAYDTGVTLRQLYYRLVAEQLIPNVSSAYKGLSARTAEARRNGMFPSLVDRGRTIHRPVYFADPPDALDALVAQYRLDRTTGQFVSLYLGVEKAGLVNQLTSWFGRLGLPVLPLGGYASQTYVDDVVADVEDDAREAVLIYAGDFDPSGEDIDRDFEARSDCWDLVVRIALNADQVASYNLPPAMGKRTDSRSAAFEARHGQLVQVELDALPPDDLRRLYQNAIDGYWDTSRYEQVLAREAEGKAALQAIAGGAQ